MGFPALSEQPAWIGVLLIAGSLLLLLAGWRLIRWTTMLLTAGAVIGAALFWLEPHLPQMWTWITAVSCGVLAGALGWFAYQLLAALQACVLAGALTISGMLAAVPTVPALAYGLGCGVGAVAGIIGWRTAAMAAIIQTVLIGYAGVLVGMVIVCRPETAGEALALAVVVALITLPAGAMIQWRAQRREQQP